MDPTTEYLSDYACRLTYEDLSPEAIHQLKRTLVDSLGCALGAFDSEPASIEAPFTIDPAEFVEQSIKLATRSTADARLRAAIERDARRVFRDTHIVHADALRNRRIGFVGAGRIVSVAADLCRLRGVQNLTVYSPSLADSAANDPQTESRPIIAMCTCSPLASLTTSEITPR